MKHFQRKKVLNIRSVHLCGIYNILDRRVQIDCITQEKGEIADDSFFMWAMQARKKESELLHEDDVRTSKNKERHLLCKRENEPRSEAVHTHTPRGEA